MMQTNNQNQNSQSGDTSTVKMVPMSSSISQHGTSVSYGIQSGNTSTALTNTAFNSVPSGNTNQFGWSNTYPMVSASQFGLLNSGAYNNISAVSRRSIAIQPSVDISETSSDIVVSAFVTNGVTNDLSLNVKEDSLTITGSVFTGNDTFIINRTVPLTTCVRAEAVDATLHSGVLEIRLPKTEKK